LWLAFEQCDESSPRGGSRDHSRSRSSRPVVHGCDTEVPEPFSGAVVRVVDWLAARGDPWLTTAVWCKVAVVA